MKVKLNVEGMTCSHCESAVKTAIKKLKGVKKITASAQENYVEIEYNENKQTLENIINSIKNTGFTVKE